VAAAVDRLVVNHDKLDVEIRNGVQAGAYVLAKRWSLISSRREYR
jgi:hypothetical protein